MFTVGQWVVYPAHGVGKVTAIEPPAPPNGLRLYAIYFAHDKMKLWVPVRKNTTLRALTAKPALKQALRELIRPRSRSRQLWHLREMHYREQLYSGDIKALATLARNLFITDAEEQSYSERDFYDRALWRLADEVATIMDWHHADATALLEEALTTKKLPPQLEHIA
jgi:CarD family transcriptional regulator